MAQYKFLLTSARQQIARWNDNYSITSEFYQIFYLYIIYGKKYDLNFEKITLGMNGEILASS